MTTLPPDPEGATGANGAAAARPQGAQPPSGAQPASHGMPTPDSCGTPPTSAPPDAPPLLWPRRKELLTPGGAALIASLIGTGVSLNRTARRFPHIVNRLASVRHLPEERERLFDSLFFTTRPRRQGLPSRVLAELLAFRAWVERRRTNLSP